MLSRRYLAMWCAVLLLVAAAALASFHVLSGLWIAIPAALVALGLYDLNQDRHAILRNYPLWGHFRFLFEFIRPEIRQYFVEDDTDEKPFSRAQRSAASSISARRTSPTIALTAPSSTSRRSRTNGSATRSHRRGCRTMTSGSASARRARSRTTSRSSTSRQ